jgi:hypothetical protein
LKRFVLDLKTYSIFALYLTSVCIYILRQKGVANAEEKMNTSIEMLSAREVKYIAELAKCEKQAKVLARANRMAEAKNMLREKAIKKTRLETNRNVLNQLQSIKREVEDSHIIAFSVDAMANVARQFNHSGVNVDRMYTQLTNAQDSISNYMDQSDEIRNALSTDIGPVSAPTDDDLQSELDALLSDDTDDAFVSQMPVVPTTRLTTPQQLTAPALNVLESLRARHAV